jgi:ubiquinone/menaquinone biosynthesis C-methylase UbiE
MSVEEFFDTTAERYDRRYDDQGAAGRLLRQRLAVAADLLGEPTGHVLDVGMGTGRLCVELDRRGWQVSGVDLSPAMVAAARLRLPQIAERLVEGSIERLPFRAQAFEAVAATGVLEYATHDLDGAAAELARVLGPQGVAVMSFPRQQSPGLLWRSRVLYPAVRLAKRVVPFGRPAPLDLPPRSEQEFLTSVAKAGLAVEETRTIGRFASHVVVRARKRR